MIRSFSDKRTAEIFASRVAKGFSTDILASARWKLAILDAAESLDDLRSPPGNRLEALKGNRAGQHAIRVRATTTTGETQPLQPLWNPPGYMRNVVESVKVQAS